MGWSGPDKGYAIKYSQFKLELFTDVYGGTEPIDPTIVHPTAATPMLYNRYAAPFVFLVTDLPQDYREWLVTAGVHKVDSHLSLLFVENGVPIPHDYVVTLTNYNMKTDSEVLCECTHQRVRRSVTDLLFDKPSDVSLRIADFIRKFRDNLEDTYSDAEAHRFVRNSVLVKSLDVTVPGTRITTTVYNVYIHPPTVDPRLLEHWRKWIPDQKFHADTNGVGVRYQHPWNASTARRSTTPVASAP